MPKRSSKDRDFTVIARGVVEQAIGQHLDGTPLPNPDENKNPHAVALEGESAKRLVAGPGRRSCHAPNGSA